MRLPGVKTAKTFSRWVQARILGGALILGYHRIADVTHDDHEVCVTPDHFAEQMEMLSRHANPVSLKKLVHHLKEGSLPPKSVAVTFDDGYVDNLYEAKPVLEKYAIPATVFVCTGYAGKEFWWDEVERLIRSSRAELGAFRLEVDGNDFVWEQPDASPEAGVDVPQKIPSDVISLPADAGVEEQRQAMDTIRDWADVSSKDVKARAMTSE
jgi:peptidoglycan/xylan/chitin deacetylase (PgdA/CDA1 family)